MSNAATRREMSLVGVAVVWWTDHSGNGHDAIPSRNSGRILLTMATVVFMFSQLEALMFRYVFIFNFCPIFSAANVIIPRADFKLFLIMFFFFFFFSFSGFLSVYYFTFWGLVFMVRGQVKKILYYMNFCCHKFMFMFFLMIIFFCFYFWYIFMKS